MTKTGLEFGISVIVICLIFEICDLEFLFLQYFNTLTTKRHHLISHIPPVFVFFVDECYLY